MLEYTYITLNNELKYRSSKGRSIDNAYKTFVTLDHELTA